MTVDERALCATTAHFIRSHRILGTVSLLLTGVGLLLLFAGGGTFSVALSATVIAVGSIERYLALRLQFDCGLFEELARNERFTLQNLDASLQALGLRKANVTPRALTERIHGTQRLYRVHAVCVGLQLALLLTLTVVS
jgi:hypothetical protein